MNTAFLLMAQYNGQAVIPIESVCRDYFSHLTLDKFFEQLVRWRLTYRFCVSRQAKRVPGSAFGRFGCIFRQTSSCGTARG